MQTDPELELALLQIKEMESNKNVIKNQRSRITTNNSIPNFESNDIIDVLDTRDLDLINQISNYENRINNYDMYPDPDNMTYEQLLDLEDRLGHVSNGLTKKEIEVKL